MARPSAPKQPRQKADSKAVFLNIPYDERFENLATERCSGWNSTACSRRSTSGDDRGPQSHRPPQRRNQSENTVNLADPSRGKNHLKMGSRDPVFHNTTCQAPFGLPKTPEPVSFVAPAHRVRTNVYSKQYFVRPPFASGRVISALSSSSESHPSRCRPSSHFGSARCQ